MEQFCIFVTTTNNFAARRLQAYTEMAMGPILLTHDPT